MIQSLFILPLPDQNGPQVLAQKPAPHHALLELSVTAFETRTLRCE